MAANIGPITAKIVASAEGMTAGLKEARDKTKASMMGVTEDAKKAGKEAGSGWFETFKGVLAGNLATAAVTGAFSKLTEAFSEGNRAILEMGTAARKAGVDLGGLQAVAETLGGDVGKATEAMLKLQESVGKAIVEGADEPFEKLGLDAVALSAMRADEQILTISRAMEDMQSPITRARIGVQLFGDQWKEVAELLEDGGKDLAETRKALDQFGAGFGENAFQAAKEANKVFRDLQFLAKGFYNQVGQAISPILAEFKASFGSLAEYGVTFKGLKDTIINVAEAMAKAGAFVMEAWADTSLITRAWNVFFQYLRSGITQIEAAVTSMLSELPGFGNKKILVEGLEFKAQSERSLADAMARMLGKDLAKLDSFKRIDEAFARIRDRATETGQAIEVSNPFEIWSASIDKLANDMRGAFDTFADEARRIQGMIAYMTDVAIDFAIDGIDIGVEQMLEPAYRKLGELTQRLAATSSMTKFSGAMEQNSREAYSTILASQYQDRRSVEEIIAQSLREQTQQQKLQVEIGRQAARALDKLNNKLEVRTFP